VDDPLAVVVITTFVTDHVTGCAQSRREVLPAHGHRPGPAHPGYPRRRRGRRLDRTPASPPACSPASPTPRLPPPRQPIVPLTEREESVAVTVAQGKANADIAAEPHISLRTAKFHIASLMKQARCPETASR
jgi:DNA-binding CsgD family transcriptional regulator